MKHRPASVSTPKHRRPARRRALRSVLWGAVFLVLLGFGGLAGMLALTGRTLPLPQMAVVWVEEQVNARLAGGGTVAMGAVDAHLACIHSYTREPLLFCVPHTLRGWQHVSGYCRLPPLVVKSERYLSPKKSYLRGAVSMAEDGDDPEQAGSKKSKKNNKK